MPPPLVSVVIATYNRRSRLERALEPLLADPDLFEVVVVVDGSRDGSIELLREISERDERLRPILTENRGESEARCTGVEAARGEVILILDDDEVADRGLAGRHAFHHAGPERKVVVGYTPISLPEKRSAEAFATFVYDRHYEAACREYEREPETILSARRPRAERVWAALLYPATLILGRARLFSLQTSSAQLLRRIEHQRGAIEFAAAVEAGLGAASRSRTAVPA